jgi:hypothetical protein
VRAAVLVLELTEHVPVADSILLKDGCNFRGGAPRSDPAEVVAESGGVGSWSCAAVVAIPGERHTSHVTRHTSHVTRYMSHVTRHTSHVTRHTSISPPRRRIIDKRVVVAVIQPRWRGAEADYWLAGVALERAPKAEELRVHVAEVPVRVRLAVGAARLWFMRYRG